MEVLRFEKLTEFLSLVDSAIEALKGKLAARFARENQIPFLGLCFGMQIAVIEFARNVADRKKPIALNLMPKRLIQ